MERNINKQPERTGRRSQRPVQSAPVQEQTAQQRWQELKKAARVYWNAFREWSRIHGRRAAHLVHNTVAVNRAIGPVSFLATAGALGVALTLTTLYSPSYAVIVDGNDLGAVADQSVVEQAIQTVEQAGTNILGYDYQVEQPIDYQFALTLKSNLASESDIETYFFQQLDELSVELRKYQVSVDGQVVGVVKDRTALDGMLDQLKAQYVTEDTISAGFAQEVDIQPVYATQDLLTVEEMRTALERNTTGETTYTVAKGDTFNAIAYANDMSVSDLKALNPDIDINRLMIGDVLNVKELIPLLSVETVDDVTYTEAIPCPVETQDDPNLYKGDSKIITQGEEGEALVSATVTYLNGRETQREVRSSEILREPTTTVKAVGTKERPKTASTGKFQWPIRGRITSYFGGRNIFGSYSYHSGLDIAASYGAAICAADGGTVTFAGTKGTYGKLVIITHDNGTQTYYAHNSSLLVSAGQKVYKGQQIAKAGSTGRSTGVHCHFEVRVRGTAVNPLSYLP